MTKGSNGLLVVPGEERSSSNAGFWSKDYPCYAISFLFNRRGLIQNFGTVRNLPSQKLKRYSLGTFLVVVDMPSIRAMLERRYDDRNCPKERKEDDNPAFQQERIVAVYYPEKTLERVVRRLEKTKEAYNKQYGFDPDYQGFTAGNFLDDDPLFL